jgi:1-aminocyclopropane-1-carboxylate deaminase
MEFEFVSRTDYHSRMNQKIYKWTENGELFYLIPEGGTNSLAIQGCQEILNEE